MTTTSKSQYREDVQLFFDNVARTMFGKEQATKYILISIICNDHVLVEDVPGTGKTLLINTIAKALDLNFKRIQGTPDLLPSDLTGVNIFDQKEQNFKFIKGPIFTNILLFDEINRTSPKTQSALLEAMQEKQVSLDNHSYKLDTPFFVIATQNPIEFLGTYPLPQAQLDRFLMKIAIGYPTKSQELEIMKMQESTLEASQENKLEKDTLLRWQKEYQKVYIKDEILEKLQDIFAKTRNSENFKLGISPRAGRKFVCAIKASAYIQGRDFVTKDDIYELFLPVMSHRVFAKTKDMEVSLLENILKEANI